MTAAGRLGEQLARELERQSREAQARSEQAARELGERLRAEREAARASLAPVNNNEWWDTASGEDVTKAYTTARAWSELDPEAKQAEERIVREVRERYGIDVSDAPDQVAVSEAIERAERARAEANEQRSAAGDDRAEAVGVTSQADAIDRAAEAQLFARLTEDSREFVEDMRERHGIDVLDPRVDDNTMREVVGDAARADYEHEHTTAQNMRGEAGVAYDSAERREALAHSLDGIENRAAVDARLRSDVAQGRPAADAVAKAPGQAPKAKKAPQGIQGRQVQRQVKGR
ncbi:hypothetical protein [Luteococcus peritonei]|uniref:Colicin import membrane protein n=1 Tax=Luteococcus peritonei TaxID=88874 RepID=A0ABW4RW80_9ACTN